MISRAFVFLSLLFAGVVSAQTTVDRDHFDLGEITPETDRVLEFHVMNKGEKEDLILRMDQDREVQIKFSSKRIPPNSYATVRMKYNPQKQGRFNKTLNLYVASSHKAIEITLEGKNAFVDREELPCPDFNSTDPYASLYFNALVQVRDQETQKPLKGARVTLIKNGQAEVSALSDKAGMAKPYIPLGLYYAVVQAPGYQSAELPVYLNRRNNRLQVALRKDPNAVVPKEPPVEDPVLAADVPKESVPEEELQQDDPKDQEEEIVIHLDGEEKEVVAREEDNKPEEPVEEDSDLDRGEFSLKDYAQNNIVFLIDVSGSMRQEGRMDLLKASMLELLELLRPEDKVAILTYTSSAKIELHPQAVVDKERIKTIIMGLQARGKTQGGNAIREAYKQLQEHFITEGNNQIIMVTDGDFNDNYKLVLRTVKRNAKRNKNISLVGLKNRERFEEGMRAIAEAGNGHFIHIADYESAKGSLVEEIKKMSKLN